MSSGPKFDPVLAQATLAHRMGVTGAYHAPWKELGDGMREELAGGG